LKKIGLIGGMSWESTALYYKIINEEVKKKLGGSHSAECLMYSFDFQEVEELQSAGKWDELTDIMVNWAIKLKEAGADFIVICANTMHLMAPAIEDKAKISVLHIADVTGRSVIKAGLKKVVLLGTKYVMEGTFYKDVLKNLHDVDVIVPSKENRQIIHDIIYSELIKGIISEKSKEKYIEIISELFSLGAEGVVLGCTEIPLLIKQEDFTSPVFNTTEIHSKAAVEYALKTD
jgi:aspartate racemase